MEAGAVVNPAEKFRHKNRLQEFAQRASIPLPLYQTSNEGTQHMPKFRSTVVVDETKYISPCVFVKRKEAEQYVAKFALEGILAKIRQEGVPLINDGAAFCKTILHEYAAKMRKELPKYTTSKTEGLIPTFTTTVVFDGRSYSGYAGRSIKEGEQLAARTVIGWILGHSDTSIDMAEIIRSKGKLFDIFRKSSTSVVPKDDTVVLEVPGDTTVKDNHVHTEPTNGNLLPVPAVEHANLPAATNPEGLRICGACSGTSGGSTTTPALKTSNQPEGPTDGPVNHVSESPCPEQVIQVKEEVPSQDPPMPQGQLQTPNPTSSEKTNSGKRARKGNKKGSSSKRARSDE